MDLYKYKCKVPCCSNVYYMNPTKINKHFFTFPKLRSLREQWFNAINFNCNETIPYSASKMYICEDHFSENCFVSTLKKDYTGVQFLRNSFKLWCKQDIALDYPILFQKV
jgi:hypothetical protein